MKPVDVSLRCCFIVKWEKRGVAHHVPRRKVLDGLLRGNLAIHGVFPEPSLQELADQGFGVGGIFTSVSGQGMGSL